MVEMVSTIIITILVFRYMSVLFMDDRASDWMYYYDEDIKDLLSAQGYALYIDSCYDCAPCELEFGIHPINDTTNLMCVPSRKMKRLIRKLNKGKITCEGIIRYQNKYGNPVHPKKKPMR